MSLYDRARALPRSARWLVGAVVAFASYFLVVEPALEWKLGIDAKSDRVATRLDAFRRGESARATAREAIDLGVRRITSVAFPEEQAARSQVFNRRIDDIFGKHGVRDRTTRTRTSPLPRGPLDPAPPAPSHIPPNTRLERLIADIQFTASPESVSALLADLEQTQEVAAVSRVSLEKPSGERGSSERVLAVNLTVEAWVLVRRGNP